MKELIDKLSLGIIEYIKPVIEVSADSFSLSIEAEKVQEGSFKIVSANKIPLKGIIFSTDNRFLIENNQFIGIDNTIRYKVNTEYAKSGEEIKGNINIISNGGEVTVPFNISVISARADTTRGSVKNLFHFANLVQMSYEEAVKLFESSSFSHIFLENDLPLMAVYNGLIGSRDINIAMEDFLVAANKKKAVSISISKANEEYNNINQDYGDILTVKKDTWGYVSIDIEVIGDFIGTDRNILTSNEFAGNKYELSYYIKKDKLHSGKNIGRIRLTTLHQTIDYTISVNMDGRKGKPETEADREIKMAVETVLKKYLDFRMQKIDLHRWVEDSDSVITRARGIKDSMFLKLLQAHVYMTKGNEKDASWLLENVAEDLLSVRENEVELYCYYLYVRTIQKRDDKFTREVIEKIKEYCENGYDSWRLLWILLLIDQVYDNNISIKLLRIKDKYMKGMRSPLLYFEALGCFNEMPEMLRVLDDFEIQVLNFGIKNDFINKKLALQISDLIKTERKFNPLIFKIITNLYDKYNDENILENICVMLIKFNRTEEKYFKWFDKCINKKMKITGLYEYYMYTISHEFAEIIPQIVMMYFVYNRTSLPDEKVDLLYANIINNKAEVQGIYNMYKVQIEKYAADNVLKGRMNRNLAVIYKDVFTKAMIGSEMADKFADILNTYEIRCDKENISEILIVHKEINEIKRYPIKRGRAYVNIYTEDAAVIFEDTLGNRYNRSVKYEKHKLMDMEEYLKLCYEISEKNRNLTLYFGDRYLKYRKNADKSIDILKALMKINELVKPFHFMVEKEIIDYYSINYDGDSLDEYLLTVDADNLGTSARVKIMEMTIIRGLYDRTYELVRRFGFYNMEPRRVLKCVAKLIEIRECKEDILIVEMASYAFCRGKYNEDVLNYLGRYFNGTTKELLSIWKAAKDFDYENKELEERIIVQMLFTGAYVGSIDGIYDSYFKKGASGKIRKAYMFSKSYDYFVRENIVEDSVFKYIERDIYNGEDINDVCKLAFLKHMSVQDEISGEMAETCRKLIYKLAKVNKVFEFYKAFNKYFSLPYYIFDKTVAEYRTNPESRVYIHYIIEDGYSKDNEYKIAQMTDMCNGVFTYQFVLFYGESVQYYITEENDSEVLVTESSSIKMTDVEFANDSTQYGMLNDILVCREMREERTFEKMAKDYIIKKELMNTIFEIKR